MRVLLLMPMLALALAAPPSAGVKARLTITVWPNGEGASSRAYTLACPAAVGTLPRARAACRSLAKRSRKDFAPVPQDAVCTMIYGGPQVTRVTGSLTGAKLWATFKRRNGCEIARWNRLAFLFPVPTGP